MKTNLRSKINVARAALSALNALNQSDAHIIEVHVRGYVHTADGRDLETIHVRELCEDAHGNWIVESGCEDRVDLATGTSI